MTDLSDKHVGQRRVCGSFVCVHSCTETKAFAEQTMERGHRCKNNLFTDQNTADFVLLLEKGNYKDLSCTVKCS